MDQGRQAPQQSGSGQYDDEISLIDLFLVIMRRKWLIAGVIMICAGLGTGYALLMQGEPVYHYTTVIELGRLDDGALVEDLRVVRSLLVQTLIPLFRSEMLDAQAEPGYRPPEVSVEIVEGNNRLILLSSDSTESSKPELLELHSRTIEELQKEYNYLFTTKKLILERQKENLRRGHESDMENYHLRSFSLVTEVEGAESKVKRFIEERRFLNYQLNRIQEEKAQLNESIIESEERLIFVRKLQLKAPAEATDEARAMTLLMIQDQIEKAESRLAGLRNRLTLEIPEHEDSLRLSLLDNEISNHIEQRNLYELKEKKDKLESDKQRTQDVYAQNLDEIEDKLTLMKPTEARYVALQSIQPLGGTSKKLILGLSLVLGSMLGVFGAFFAEFINKARAAAREQVSG